MIIPVRNEESHIERCLASALAQSYPSDRTEVLVVDGRSSDRTRDIVERVARDVPRVALLDNPRHNQAAAMNIGFAHSSGDVIARLDGHAEWQPDHLERCVELLERTGADNVGGTMVPRGESPTAIAVGAATQSRFGAGGATYRWGDKLAEVDTVWLGCFRRSALERVGGYDEELPPHEDYELNARIRSTGGRIVFSPDVRTGYWPRADLRALGKQYYRYGLAKTRANRRTPGLVRVYHLGPPALTVCAALALPAIAGGGRSRLVALGGTAAYGATVLGVSLARGRGLPPAAAARLPLVFPVLHLSWGAGFLAGTLERWARRTSG